MLEQARNSASAPLPFPFSCGCVTKVAGKLPRWDVISGAHGRTRGRPFRPRMDDGGHEHATRGSPTAAGGGRGVIKPDRLYQQMVAERRTKRPDDLTTARLEAEIDGDRLNDDEVLGH